MCKILKEITLIFMVTVILLVAVITTAPAAITAEQAANSSIWSQSDNNVTTTAEKLNLKWTSRLAWQAAPPRHITSINVNSIGGDTTAAAAVPYVIIHHTVKPSACRTDNACRSAMRAMQRNHQQDRGWDDIGYNFVIGGNAEIYEGRGFNVSGAHAVGYNSRSVGIVLMGDWTAELPPRAMLDKAKQLITFGIQMGYIQSNYTLLGHRQVSATECPGTRLFNEIKQWTHFSQGNNKN